MSIMCVWLFQVEESLVLPTQPPSESELFIEDDQLKEEQALQKVDKKDQYSSEVK